MNENYVNDLKIVEEILTNIKIPGKKDSMLAAAKLNHIENLGILLNNILTNTCLVQHEIDDVVNEFKKKYEENFLKFIQKKE